MDGEEERERRERERWLGPLAAKPDLAVRALPAALV